MKNALLVLHDSIFPIRGGGALRVMATAREFMERGMGVRIIAPSERKEYEGITIDHIDSPSKERMFVSVLAFNLRLLQLLITLKSEIDLIFCHNAIAGILCTIFGKLFNKRVVLDVTDIHTEYLLSKKQGVIKGIILKGARKLEYWSFQNADELIVVSRQMQKLIEAHGVTRKMHVIYDGVEVDKFFKDKEKSDEIIIIHHGGVDNQDGVHYIPLAAKEVVKHCKNVKFWIVGGGSKLDYVKSVAKKEGVVDYFVFTGWVPYDNVKDYLKKADIGLITRPNTVPNNTVLTLKLLEYWASSTAAVSPRLKAIEEVSEDGKDIMLYEPDNPMDLANKIMCLINNNQQIHAIQKCAREKAVNYFDWKVLSKDIADITLDNSNRKSL